MGYGIVISPETGFRRKSSTWARAKRKKEKGSGKRVMREQGNWRGAERKSQKENRLQLRLSRPKGRTSGIRLRKRDTRSKSPGWGEEGHPKIGVRPKYNDRKYTKKK